MPGPILVLNLLQAAWGHPDPGAPCTSVLCQRPGDGSELALTFPTDTGAQLPGARQGHADPKYLDRLSWMVELNSDMVKLLPMPLRVTSLVRWALEWGGTGRVA